MPSAPKITTLNILPPLGGIVRKLGFQQQEPFTCINSVNLWPLDPNTGRQVLAARPPMDAFPTPGAGGINLAVAVNGDGTFQPSETFLVARAGTLYRWNGSHYNQIDLAYTPPTISTGRPVYAAAFDTQVVIANNGVPLVYEHGSAGIGIQRLTQLTATAGEVPVDCRCVAVFQGCACWGGKPGQEHILFMSRTGDITDYNYAALPDDEGGAFATSGLNEGLIGDPIRALMPLSEDTMIVGCSNSMYALSGHPRRGGIMRPISENLGPLGQGAYCTIPSGEMFVLTKGGLVMIDRQAVVSLISREKVPDDLIGLPYNALNPTVSMAYDTRWNMIFICVRGEREQAWYYDLGRGGFGRMTLDDYPTVMLNVPSLDGGTVSGTLFCGDGYGGIGQFDVNGTETIAWRLMAGPMKLSRSSLYKSKMQLFQINLGMPSDVGAYADLYFGFDPEEAYQNALLDRTEFRARAVFTELFDNGGKFRPKLSGHALILHLHGSGNVLFEGATCELIDAGTQKRLRDWDVSPQVYAGPDATVEFS